MMHPSRQAYVEDAEAEVSRSHRILTTSHLDQVPSSTLQIGSKTDQR